MSKNNKELKQENIDKDLEYCPECGRVLPSYLFCDNKRCIRCNSKKKNRE